jgi:hypothetical protein
LGLFGQLFEKSKIIGTYIQKSDSINSTHLITNSTWTIQSNNSNIDYLWDYKYELEKQPNNQPDLIHEYLTLKTNNDSLIIDIVKYWTDTLFFYNTSDNKPWFLIPNEK